MFTELMPLLRKRGLLITISLVEGDTLRATVLPREVHRRRRHSYDHSTGHHRDSRRSGSRSPTSVDRIRGSAYLQLQRTLASAKEDMDAAAKAAREEARKKTSKPTTLTKASVPDAPAKPESESEPVSRLGKTS